MVNKSKPRKSVSFVGTAADDKDALAAKKLASSLANFHSWTIIPVHVPVLLAYVYPILITNPRKGLTTAAYTLYACQIAYSLLILITRTALKSKKPNGDENQFLLLLSSLVVTALLSGPIFVILILLGAPLYGLLFETYLLALNLLGLIFLPLLVYYKLNFALLRAAFAPGEDNLLLVLASNQLIFSATAGIIGTWFGVLPIPLDWDREWQQWPITLLIGGYVGYFVGSILSVVLNLFV